MTGSYLSFSNPSTPSPHLTCSRILPTFLQGFVCCYTTGVAQIPIVMRGGKPVTIWQYLQKKNWL